MISRCPNELAPVTGLDDPTVASWQVGDDADQTRLDFSQVAERPHLETATGRNGSFCDRRRSNRSHSDLKVADRQLETFGSNAKVSGKQSPTGERETLPVSVVWRDRHSSTR